MNAQSNLLNSTHFEKPRKSGENKLNDFNNVDSYQDKIIEDKNTYKGEEKNPQNNKSKKVPVKCAQCDYKSGDMSNLKRHKRTKHGEGGLWYFCRDCDYSSADKSYLKKHIYFKHESIRHPCE